MDRLTRDVRFGPNGVSSRIIFMAVAVVLAIAFSLAMPQTSYAADKGDVNDDGQVNIVDAQIIYDMANGAWTQSGEYDKLLAQLSGWNLATLKATADVNEDGVVDAQDARAIQTYLHTGSVPVVPKTSFTVTFKDWDGTVLKTQVVEAGENATPPANLYRQGYRFDKWNASYTSVNADTTVMAVYTQISGPVISVGHAKINASDSTVAVPVIIMNNPGISSLMADVAYGKGLTLTDVSFSSSFGSYITAPMPYANPQRINLISPLADISANGTLATLTFATNGLKAGDIVDVTVTYDQSNTFNMDFDDVVFSVQNGFVEVG